ncbi:hypothetical protein B0T21DRAFT_299181 [Apiosordaria backusii]|uniref:FAD/NAD(P)-binding domain-containing protein n=1 Tax=Apiosordaria backusii TaxID=314023 RepID=A0AA39ZV53_9PEZI|nr:hypothetical protein B0T21DRAFT_299181 [Apiosordaria backusii]
MADTKTVVILGGSLGGLHVAHALLKKHQQYPKLRNTHFYWNIASVRAIIPGQIPDAKILRDLSEALQPYPSKMYELVIGEAISSDFTAKTVKIQLPNSEDVRKLTYDHLVLATGARYTNDTPWKANSDYQSLLTLLHDTASKVEKAKHIIVAGAGATGVEVAGELGYEYGKTKTITLLASGNHVLPGEQESFSSATENELKKLNVHVQKLARVKDVTRILDEGEEKYTVKLESGQDLDCDLYLPTQGMVPNSDYINAKHLDGKTKTVLVDEFLHVTGVPGSTVWAVGDIVSKPRAGFMITQKQAASVAKNVEAVLLQNKQPVPAKGPPVDILACAVGRGRGVGRMGSIRLPSFGVWLAKGRTLGMQMVDQYISGSVA